MRLTKLSLLACATAAVVAAIVVSGRPSLLAGPSPGVSKQTALDHIAKNVLVPAYSDLAARARDFSIAADALTSAPTPSSLDQAQRAWRDVLLAWQRTQAFAHGPVADLGVAGRMRVWPWRRQSIDRVLRAQRPIDDGYILELGANAVGLSALEGMLFDPGQDTAARVAAFSGATGARQREYCRALARELVKSTASVEKAWRGAAGYAATFGKGGQDQLNLVVNDLLAAIETGAQERLRRVVDPHVDPLSRAALTEGGLSDTSQSGLLALVTGAQTLFNGASGPGLDDYLKALKPATARRAEVQFQKAVDSVAAIDGSLERAVTANPQLISRAWDACRALEILLKTEVASTLGVTLTFKSKDGD
jgi:predicted lipoprotein